MSRAGTIEQAPYAPCTQAEFIASAGTPCWPTCPIAPIGSLPQAAQALYILASPESPLAQRYCAPSPLQLQLAPADADPALTAHYAALLVGTRARAMAPALDRSLRLVADIQQALAKIAALPLGTALPSGGEDIGANAAA